MILDLRTKIILICIASVLLIFGYLVVVRPKLRDMGIIKSSQDKTTEKLYKQAQFLGYWTSNYYQDYQQSLQLTSTEADAIAKKINKAFGLINDDETALTAAFRQIKSKAQLSYIVKRYYDNYNADLLTDLGDKLNLRELYPILIYTSKLN